MKPIEVRRAMEQLEEADDRLRNGQAEEAIAELIDVLRKVLIAIEEE